MTVRLVLSIAFFAGVILGAQDAAQRCGRAADLLAEIMATPEHSIPRDLLRRAHCVALIPGVKKVGFVVGGKYGKGVLVCRTGEGTGWSGPSTVRLEGGSFGLQIGGSSTDVVLLVMNEEGADKLRASKFTLGADAAVAGGPVGRSAQAQTDAQMHAKILSYSRSRGLFAGLSLEGATLRPDADANRNLYGHKVTHDQILKAEIPPPPAAWGLLETLAQYASAEAGQETAAQTVETGLEGDALPRDLASLRQEPGVITITSEPSIAEVELNGYFNGMTPRSKQVKPGEYQVTLRKAGFEDWVQTVTVGPGERVTVGVELTAAEAGGNYPGQ